MKVNAIDHIGIVVDDLDESEGLVRQFGLTDGDIVKLPHVEGRFLHASNASIELVQFFTEAERAERLGEGNKARIDHIAFRVDDIDAIAKALGALGIELTGPPLQTDGAVSIWTKPESSGGVMFQFIQRD
jgi:methylmalonyl-CoA/ethylmalonyl-CoA epimerase